MNNLNSPQKRKKAFSVTEAEKQEITDICNNSADWTTLIESITFLQKRRLQEERKKLLDELEETNKSEREYKACVKNLEKEGSKLRSDLFEKEDEIQSLKQHKKNNEDTIKILKREKDELAIALEKVKVEKESFRLKIEKLERNLQNVQTELGRVLQDKLEILQAHDIYHRTLHKLNPGYNFGDSMSIPVDNKRKTPHVQHGGCFSPGEVRHPIPTVDQHKRARSGFPPPPYIGPINFSNPPPPNDFGNSKNVPGPTNTRRQVMPSGI